MDTQTKPPVTSVSHTLPFDKLAPLDFERLCLWLVQREGYVRAEHLGEAGSESGRDVVAWKDGRRVVFQCKRVKAFTAATARAEIEKIRGLSVEEQPHELVFVVSQAVSAEARSAARRAWGDEANCHFWSGSELDERVKRHRDILNEFFQLPTGCLSEVAALLYSIGRGLRRRWQWSVAVALVLGAGVSCWLWWTAHQRAQLYDRGRQAMAELNFQEAQMLLEEAGANHDPVVRSALAEALMNLGQKDRAGREADSALNQSKKLPYQDRLLVEARYYRIRENWSEALARYQKLHEGEPAEVEYAVGIAETQIALDRSEEALSLIKKMQKISTDPRLDLAQGRAAYYLSDFSQQVKATSRAIEKAEARGLRSLASKGLLYRGNAFLSQGDMEKAGDDFERAEKLAGDNLDRSSLPKTAVPRSKPVWRRDFKRSRLEETYPCRDRWTKELSS